MREIKSYQESTTKRWRIQKDSLVKLIEDFLKDKDWILSDVNYPNLNDDLSAKFPSLDTDFILSKGEEKLVYSLVEREYENWPEANERLLAEINQLVSHK